MTDAASFLFPVLLILPVVDWMVTVILVSLARSARPRIAVLSERAFGAVVVSIVTTVYAFVALNTEQGYAIIASDTARVVLRLAMIGLGAAPLVWLVLYWRRRR